MARVELALGFLRIDKRRWKTRPVNIDLHYVNNIGIMLNIFDIL